MWLRTATHNQPPTKIERIRSALHHNHCPYTPHNQTQLGSSNCYRLHPSSIRGSGTALAWSFGAKCNWPCAAKRRIPAQPPTSRPAAVQQRHFLATVLGASLHATRRLCVDTLRCHSRITGVEII